MSLETDKVNEMTNFINEKNQLTRSTTKNVVEIKNQKNPF